MWVLDRPQFLQHPQAGPPGRHHELRRSVMPVGAGIAHRHDDEEVGNGGIGDEPLATVEHPVITVEHGAGAKQCRVRARDGFRHRIRRPPLAREQRQQELGALLRRTEAREDLRVTRIRGLRSEYVRRELRPADDLVEQTELQLAESLATEFQVQMSSPQSGFLHLLLQWRNQRPERRLVQLQGLQRVHGLLHESQCPVELLPLLRVRAELPAHVETRITRRK